MKTYIKSNFEYCVFPWTVAVCIAQALKRNDLSLLTKYDREKLEEFLNDRYENEEIFIQYRYDDDEFLDAFGQYQCDITDIKRDSIEIFIISKKNEQVA